MINIQKLIEYCEKKGIAFEYYTPNVFDRWNDRTFESTAFFGFELKPDVWYWWSVYQYETSDPMIAYFAERYNRRNGASIKSVRTGLKAERMIEDFLIEQSIINQLVA